MLSDIALLKKIFIPAEQRKRVGVSRNMYYDIIEIYENRVVGHFNEQTMMTWYFSEYIGIQVIQAGWMSQFAQIIFLTEEIVKKGINVRIFENAYAINATERILLCSGTFSFKKTNQFANAIASELKSAFENFTIDFDKK